MFKRLKPKSEFTRHVLTLMTGTTIAQAIPIAISPILTRIYTPEDFGLLAIYVSIATLLSVVATGRYEMAIMLPKKDSDSMNLVILSILITLFISFVAFVFILFFNQEIIHALGSSEISNWLYFIPITVLSTGFYQSFNYWHSRNKNYNKVAASRVLQSATTASSNLSLGFMRVGGGGLILSQLLGQIISTLYLGNKIYRKDRKKNLKIKKLKIYALAKKYKKFPLINTFHAFVNILKDNIVNIFIAAKYSQATLGHYYFMIKLMKLPAGIFGASIAQVFYKSASVQYNKNKNIQVMVTKLIFKLLLVLLLPISILYIYVEDIFAIIFGKEWAIAGVYAQAIIPYIVFHFLASPMAMVPLITDKQEKAFFWGLFESLLFVGIFILSYTYYNDLAKTLKILSAVMGVYFMFYFMWIYKISKDRYE